MIDIKVKALGYLRVEGGGIRDQVENFFHGSSIHCNALCWAKKPCFVLLPRCNGKELPKFVLFLIPIPPPEFFGIVYGGGVSPRCFISAFIMLTRRVYVQKVLRSSLAPSLFWSRIKCDVCGQ